MLITFSGLDGAGKSTLIDSLVVALERDRIEVSVCHMNRGVGVHAVLRALRGRFRVAMTRTDASGIRGGELGREPGVRLARTPGTSSSVHERGGVRGIVRRIVRAVIWNKRLRRLLYPVDLFLFACYRAHVERSGRVLIMDRYFYDTLVDVADGRRWRLLRLYERATPTPALPIFLDVGPEECFARKGEYSVDYLERRWKAYHHVLPWIPSVVRLAADDLDVAKATLQKLVARRLAAGPAAI